MTELQQRTAVIALRKMFAPSGWYDVCAIDAILRMANVVPPPDEYAALRLLHCVNWTITGSDMRVEAAGIVGRWFGVPEPLTDTPQPKALPAKVSGWKGFWRGPE